MLTENIRNSLLVDELQLGQRLNQDIQTNNSADFALLLSMLSQDVTDNPLYHLEKNEVKEVDLREKFQLPRAQKFYADNVDFENSSKLCDKVEDGNLASLQLSLCLNKEPLCPFEYELAPEVFSSLSPLKQEKLRVMKNGNLSYEKLREKGLGFDVIDEVIDSRKISTAV